MQEKKQFKSNHANIQSYQSTAYLQSMYILLAPGAWQNEDSLLRDKVKNLKQNHEHNRMGNRI